MIKHKKMYRNLEGQIIKTTFSSAKSRVLVNYNFNPLSLRSRCHRHGLAPDSSSGGASVLRILSPPGDSVLGQKLLPQGESSPCTGTLALGYFLRRSACPRTFPPAELLS